MAEVNIIEANAIEYEVEDTAARADIANLTTNLNSTSDLLSDTVDRLSTAESTLSTVSTDLDAAESAIAAINKVKKGTGSGTTTGGGQLYLSAATYPNLIAVVCTNLYTDADRKAVSAEIHGKSGTSWILVFRDQNGSIFAGQTASYDFYYI